MSVKGYLVFVPFENIATMQYGNNGAPDQVTVATTPGHIAGPFEVEQTVQDAADLAAALRSAVKDGALREQEAIGHLVSTCAVSPVAAASLMVDTLTEEDFRRKRLELLEYTERNGGLMSPSAREEKEQLRGEFGRPDG